MNSQTANSESVTNNFSIVKQANSFAVLPMSKLRSQIKEGTKWTPISNLVAYTKIASGGISSEFKFFQTLIQNRKRTLAHVKQKRCYFHVIIIETRILKTKSYFLNRVETCIFPFIVPHIAVEQLGDDVQSSVTASELGDNICMTSSISVLGLTWK